jgi:hypothetical protein
MSKEGCAILYHFVHFRLLAATAGALEIYVVARYASIIWLGETMFIKKYLGAWVAAIRKR